MDQQTGIIVFARVLREAEISLNYILAQTYFYNLSDRGISLGY